MKNVEVMDITYIFIKYQLFYKKNVYTPGEDLETVGVYSITL